MLVKRRSMSKLAMIQFVAKLTNSSGKGNESWSVNSLAVKSDKIGNKDFATLYVGYVPVADKTGRKEGPIWMMLYVP